MSTEIEQNQNKVLEYLYKLSTEEPDKYVQGSEIKIATELSEERINDAVELLSENGFIEREDFLGTAPYVFGMVKITARGKYEVQRRESIKKAVVQDISAPIPPAAVFFRLLQAQQSLSIKPPIPIGSPFGFIDADWELVSGRKADKTTLFVVFGCKFESPHYETEELKKNVKTMFERAISRYNQENSQDPHKLEFVPLHGGYGEHLFNGIARDIISSDIAVFETSDQAPNVFIEIGVALTWGSRVFLIKKSECPPPASDVSGQTYADYSDNGATFSDPKHEEKLYRMVDRAIRKKGLASAHPSGEGAGGT